MSGELRNKPLMEIFNKYSYAPDFFNGYGIFQVDTGKTFSEFTEKLNNTFCEDNGIDKDKFFSQFLLFIERMESIAKTNVDRINFLTVIGGKDKSGEKENIKLTLKSGEIYCIVGPTGSGKSRLLADIECLAQKDTPTDRLILLNGEEPSFEKRFSGSNKIVAQLSQNMNFVMDLSVKEFITMHAESRMIQNIESVVSSILESANDLAGEKFNFDTPLTQLSGGQSRALMIADTALLSISPIILIDEIENAGIDRKKALDILVKKEKIVLMSTHDPILALMGDKRIVIRNGGIVKIIETSKEEKENLLYLQSMDEKIGNIRNFLRYGKEINFNIKEFFYK